VPPLVWITKLPLTWRSSFLGLLGTCSHVHSTGLCRGYITIDRVLDKIERDNAAVVRIVPHWPRNRFWSRLALVAWSGRLYPRRLERSFDPSASIAQSPCQARLLRPSCPAASRAVARVYRVYRANPALCAVDCAHRAYRTHRAYRAYRVDPSGCCLLCKFAGHFPSRPVTVVSLFTSLARPHAFISRVPSRFAPHTSVYRLPSNERL